MKDIYTIISEQKNNVDINIARYDLEYTINYFNNNYYVQEGLGDSIQAAAKKVVEFIKALINKIRDLIRKMVNYLFGKNSPSKRAKEFENKIKEDAKKQEEQHPEGSTVGVEKVEYEIKVDLKFGDGGHKGPVMDAEMYKGQDVSKLQTWDYMKASLRTVNMIPYVHFDEKKSIANSFMDAVYSTTGNYLQDYNVVNDLFVKSITRTCFKGAGSYKKNKDISMAERIQLELNEKNEKQQIKISDIDYEVMSSYLNEGVIKEFLNTVDKEATKSLNDLRSKIERLQKSGDENITEKDFNNIQKVVSMVGTFMNYISTNVFNAHKIFTTILLTVLMDFHSTYVSK
jgi:hypothetical protein